MVVIETAACGISIVSTDVGDIPLAWEEGVELLMTDHPDVRLSSLDVIWIFEDQRFAESLSVKARQNAE